MNAFRSPDGFWVTAMRFTQQLPQWMQRGCASFAEAEMARTEPPLVGRSPGFKKLTQKWRIFGTAVASRRVLSA
ncbi:hypothetical protein [Algiphilus sp.]|uniref:hypothetical protein n=1 Tax=Algiphilus sp. TaxID=1872431 RepID=UPI003BAA8BE8